jgi:4-amino-4-deoxy-L-arabinose transferase-like glycosyltransferase
MNRGSLYTPILLILMVFTFLVNNDAFKANTMESRNLTTAREMLEKSNWFEPTMNGELRFEKPPLPTWATAFAMHLFGQDNLSLLRLPAVLAGMLLVFFLFQLTKELTEDEKLPFLVAGTASTSLLILLMSRTISWDIFCHSFMLGAIWLIHKGLKIGHRNLKYFIGSGILMGLSFLSKGPVSFFSLLLPYLTARIFAYETNDFRINLKPLLVMILTAFVISAIWPVYIYSKYPDFSQYIANKESTAWINRTVKPFYYYWSFPVQSGIWAFLATITLVFPYARKRIEEFGNYKFLAIWIGSTVLFMSFFPEKKARYLLPVLLPLSIITAFYFRYLNDSFKESRNTKTDTILFSINGLLIACISFVAPLAVWFMMDKNGFDPTKWFKLLTLLFFWTLAFVLVRSTINKKPFVAWASMVVLVSSACVMFMGHAREMLMTNRQFRPYEELRHLQSLKNIPFFFKDNVSGKFIEVVWTSGRKIRHWNPMTERRLPTAPPLVFMCNEKPLDILPNEILENYDVTVLGLFDGNIQSRGDTILTNYITVIRNKQQ